MGKRKTYIAIIAFKTWGKDGDPIQAITNATNKVYDPKKTSFRNMRLIEVTYPENDTEKDDVDFREDGGYTLKGDAEAEHFDGDQIKEFIAKHEAEQYESARKGR